jgi:hypothetical protein
MLNLVPTEQLTIPFRTPSTSASGNWNVASTGVCSVPGAEVLACHSERRTVTYDRNDTTTRIKRSAGWTFKFKTDSDTRERGHGCRHADATFEMGTSSTQSQGGERG